MKVEKILNSKAAMVGVGVLALGVVGYFATQKAAQAATQAAGVVGNSINPLNNDNIFASGVNAVGAKLSGSSNWSLGGWIYDITHD
ncbi:hypothetical protein [Colwellia sp. E2M01]|uniref:hypothetical protein n=1 Tax=Colwellia sp. E2M01 TaxID=2841561 RepID=UPI001C099429|nr:hypothetical protein [Colwellia sp. E2M01]MBU2871968.1 hypothetical protein [Colwellia sp. E2M01]